MIRAFIKKYEEYFNTDIFIACALVILFPYGVYLMWKNKKWGIVNRILITMSLPVIIIIYMFDIEPACKEISISPDIVNLELDTIRKLEVLYEPENADKRNLVYVSSDYSVAECIDGKIYTVGEGIAKIYVYDKKSNVKSNTVTVRVVTSLEHLLNLIKKENPKEQTPENQVKPETNDTVYITKSGSKYHKEGCTSLKTASFAVKRYDAIDAGKTSCSKCMP